MLSLLDLLDTLAAEMQRTAESPDPDAVHDLRVAVRRATESLRLRESEIPRARRLRKEIKQIRENAAVVRDRDVTRQLLRRRYRLPATDPAIVYLDGQRDLAAASLIEFLKKRLEKHRPRRWRKWAGGPQ